MEERTGRAKARKLVGRDRDSLISDWKRKKMPQNKQWKKQSFTMSHKQMDAQPASEQQPPRKPNTHTTAPPHLPFFHYSSSYRWACLYAQYGISLAQFRSAALTLSLANLLPSPSLRSGVVDGQSGEKVPELCNQLFSNSQNHKHRFCPKSLTQCHAPCYEES